VYPKPRLTRKVKMQIIRNMRMTDRRKAVLALIEEGGRHWSAEEIALELQARGIAMGLATVYRALAALEAEGAIVAIEWQGKRRYEAAQKPHHDHMVCRRCGRMEEFFDPEIERRQQKAAQRCGFRIEGHQLVLYGLCAECQASEEAS